jgi:germination protein YpeB
MEREKRKPRIYDVKQTARLLVVVSSILLIGVGGLAVYNAVVKRDRDSYMREIENSYELSFYELIQSLNDIEGKLGKLVVSTGRKNQESILNEVNKLSAVATSHISHLIQNDGGNGRITKFINQLGDYAEYLYKKTANGEALSAEDKDKLGEIQAMVQTLGKELSAVLNKMDEGHKLINGYSEKDAFLADIFDGLNGTTVEYPQMIYDGPFSDAAEKPSAKGLSGDEISENEARAVVEGLFGGKGLENIEFLNEAGGVIPVYNFLAKLGGERAAYVAVTKRGGRILNMDNFRAVGESVMSDEECVETARQFAELLGFDGMKEVWVSDYDGILYVNFAYESGGVIYYPDLIKIKVASDNGEILGVETANYFLNRAERDLKAAKIDARTAAEALSDKLIIEYVRLALIPKDGKEILCYEFYCGFDGADYFVYIDAENGEEVNILRVIDSGNGKLLY